MTTKFKYLTASERQLQLGLYPTCAGHGSSSPGAEFPLTSHPDRYYFEWKSGRIIDEYQLILVTDGEGVIEFRNFRQKAKAGSVVMIKPNEWHRYRPNSKTGWRTLWIGFSGSLAEKLIHGCRLERPGFVEYFHEFSAFKHQFSEVVEIIINTHNTASLVLSARIINLLTTLSDTISTTEPNSETANLVHSLKSYLAEHCTETIDFADLAVNYGLTYRAFRYLFTKETGSSPLRFQLKERLNRAKQLLRSTSMSIATISESTGFSTPWLFNHYFRKHVGLSPSAFRNSN